MNESVFPVDAKIDNDRLLIKWNDGHESVYHPVHLRVACNCAHCVSEITGERLVRLEDLAPDLKPKEMRPVGRYGVSFEWSDGHSTGIYTFARLRELCECPTCRRPV